MGRIGLGHCIVGGGNKSATKMSSRELDLSLSLEGSTIGGQ